MPNQGFRRSYKTPPGYSQTPSGRMALFIQVYLAYVKNNDDAFKMGRLKVWIPEFSSDPSDTGGWFTVQYCSPMAGATSYLNNVKEGKKLSDTQQSYGWWSVPPDLENEVVVMFLNGDPNRGIYIGGLFQQFMNHMVPGIPGDKSFDPGGDGQDPPVAEYNRWDPNIPNSDNHTRARFDPLHEGLTAQGLYIDNVRGVGTSGARRASVSKVYGFKSPSGHNMVFDDGDDAFIRFRTKTGAQILINDTTGYVYIISGNGNSWFEISDDGIDGYSAKSISLRAQEDINLHADGQINMHAGGSWNAYGAGGGTMQFGKNLEVLVGAAANISAAGDLNLLGKGNVNLTGSGNASIKAGGTAAINSGGALGVSAGGNLFLTGSQIQQNSGSGPSASSAAEASGPQPDQQPDRQLDPTNGYPEASTASIATRMPSHEPWDGHPSSKSAAKTGPLGPGSTGVNQQGVGDEQPVGPTKPPFVPSDGKKFAMPTNGIGTSPFGMRIHPVTGERKMHEGVDIAAGVGTPVYASKGGSVTFAGPKGAGGNTIIIDHGEGLSTVYCHLSQILTSAGASVTQMQQIGKMGSTGRSTGPHLHFGVKANGKWDDPARYVPYKLRGQNQAGKQL